MLWGVLAMALAAALPFVALVVWPDQATAHVDEWSAGSPWDAFLAEDLRWVSGLSIPHRRSAPGQ